MLICYLDEAGNTGLRLDDPNQPLHFIAAVMVREGRVREMTDRLDELAGRAPTIVPLREYHAYDLFHGEGVWEGLYPRQRIAEYEKALSVLDDVCADVAYASINKPALAGKGYANPNPHTFALRFLVEKIERRLRGRSDELSQRALLVADQNHEQEQYSFDLIREMQAIGGPVGAGHGLNVTLDHFVDSVYFDRSERNRESKWPIWLRISSVARPERGGSPASRDPTGRYEGCVSMCGFIARLGGNPGHEGRPGRQPGPRTGPRRWLDRCTSVT